MPYNPGEILFDKYQVEECLGQGAFTEVYRVAHLGRQTTLALKVPHLGIPGLSHVDPEMLAEHFDLEVRLAARLNPSSQHPNLIQVYDIHRDGNEIALEKEYAPAGSLAGYIRSVRKGGRLAPIRKSVRLALDVADGLAAIHALHVVHRNLKPSNILFDTFRTAKISDLYLAQIPSSLDLGKLPTKPIQLPPSAYVSPEQMHSKHKLEPPSDVYVLGLILFEVLTGKDYYSLDSGVRASSLRPDIPQWLDDLLDHMLANEPERRPWDGLVVAGLLRAGIDQARFVPETSRDEEVFDFKVKDVALEEREQFEEQVQPAPVSDVQPSYTFSVSKGSPRSTQSLSFKSFLELLANFFNQPLLVAEMMVLAVIVLWILYLVFFR